MTVTRFISSVALFCAVGLQNGAWAQIGHQLPLYDGRKAVIDESVFIPRHPYSLFRADTVSVVMLGDVMLHTAQYQNAHELWQRRTAPAQRDSVSAHWQYDFSDFLSGVASDLREADVAIANMEFALGGQPFSGYPSFSAPDSYADYVAGLGVDVFLTANNHILDRALDGAARTLRRYDAMEGVRHTGAGLDSADFLRHNPVIIPVRGLRIAVVNFTYGTNVSCDAPYPRIFRQRDRDDLADAVRRARAAGADVVLAMPHWGVEYRYVHNQEQHDVARMLAECGADAIVGGHPHVVQDMETIDLGDRQVPVYYSMGNAVSNMSAPGTQLELMVRMKVVRYPDGDVKVLPLEHEWLWCSRPGDMTPGYHVVKVREASSPDAWVNKAAHAKMMSTWQSVRQATGLE